MTSVPTSKTGWTDIEIIRDDNKKPLEENVIFQKKIRFKKLEEKKPTGFSVFNLTDTQPGSRHGEYQAHTSDKYRFYTQWAGREHIGHQSWIKIKVWETGYHKPYLIFYKNLSDTKSKFRKELPKGSISETEYEFMKIRHHSDEIMKQKRREIRKAKLRERRLSQ